MQQTKTLGFLKKRILDTLDENTGILSGEVVADTNTDILLKKMPDCINASLSRMYESLPIKNEKALMKLFKPEVVFYCESFCEEKNTVFELSEKIKKAAVSTGFTGNGNISFINEIGYVVGKIELDNNYGELEYLKQTLEFDTPACKVELSGKITLKDFTIYKSNDGLEGRMIPPYGFNSFMMPKSLQKLEEVTLASGKSIPLYRVIITKEAGYIRNCDEDYVLLEYKKAPFLIDENTPDDYEIELEGCGFEALVCLAASELCGPDRQGTYSKLVYKYLDLSESLYTNKPGYLSRNGFYNESTRKRW